MKTGFLRCSVLVGLGLTAMGLESFAAAVGPQFRMLGLAMHQETGRNIYLGAIHLSSDIPATVDPLQGRAPKSMEYRVIARRTSIRSLLGNMLLQSEVATGHAPATEINNFADQLLSTIQGSLYAGDSFEVRQSEDMQVTAYLNGLKVATAQDIGIFDYLLEGWISENGPSSTFRRSITNTDIDDSLMSEYSAHTPTEERLATVSAWFTQQDNPADELLNAVETAVLPETDETTEALAQAPLEELKEVTPTAYAPLEAPATPANDAEPSNTSGLDSSAGHVSNAQIIATAEIVALTAAETNPVTLETTEFSDPDLAFEQLASLGAHIGSLQSNEDRSDSLSSTVGKLDEISSLDVTEYSARLAGFNTQLIKQVYTRIKYPKRAIRRALQGALELDITMAHDGTLLAVTLAQSSGHSILDGAAMEGAQAALANTALGTIDPVAIAEYGDQDKLIVPVPVAFRLE